MKTVTVEIRNKRKLPGLQVRFDNFMLEKVDAWRRTYPVKLQRQTAIRQLLEIGLRRRK